jgi:hypothetical protein
LPDYFSLKVDPESKTVDHIVVENFHPEWKNVATQLYKLRCDTMMLHYIGGQNRKYHVPEWFMDFEPGLGLVSLEFGKGTGVYLDVGRERYHSLGLGLKKRCESELAQDVINEYLRYMRLGINFVLRN